MNRINSFAPVVGRHPRVLILGSMPGRASLDAQQYYAQPRNAFWPIMGELFGALPELPYATRLEKLVDNSIALWDVLASCNRPGSLDARIERASERPNDIPRLLHRHRSIRCIFFNGAKAADVYRRRILPTAEVRAPYLVHERLPSTSPAHAALSFADKLSRWTIVRDAAGLAESGTSSGLRSRSDG